MISTICPGPSTVRLTHRLPVTDPPPGFAAAFAELQDIAVRLKPVPGKVPDVDAIEPLVRRAQVLARFCQDRIDAVRKLVEEIRGS